MQVVQALNALGFALRVIERRAKETHQHGDDCNDGRQLKYSKAEIAALKSGVHIPIHDVL